MTVPLPFSIDLSDGRCARAVRAAPLASARDVLRLLGIPRPIGTLVVIGGTEQLTPTVAAELRRQLGDAVAAMVLDDDLTVVTGGTDAGVIAILGQGLARRNPRAPVIGVAPAGRVLWRGQTSGPADDAVDLEPGHTHFVLVDGEDWGDETPLLLNIVDELASQAPVVVVLASGGSIARRELIGLVERGHRVVVLGDSRRLAGEVATAATGGGAGDVLDEALARGQVEILPSGAAPVELVARLRQRLAPPAVSQ